MTTALRCVAGKENEVMSVRWEGDEGGGMSRLTGRRGGGEEQRRVHVGKAQEEGMVVKVARWWRGGGAVSRPPRRGLTLSSTHLLTLKHFLMRLLSWQLGKNTPSFPSFSPKLLGGWKLLDSCLATAGKTEKRCSVVWAGITLFHADARQDRQKKIIKSCLNI